MHSLEINVRNKLLLLLSLEVKREVSWAIIAFFEFIDHFEVTNTLNSEDIWK